jgi:gluconate:H+ symporter, GntP family
MNSFLILSSTYGFQISPLFILIIGMATVIGMILFFRINAFIALITAAIIVSLLSPGEFSEKITRVAESFGSAAGKIGIVIALAAIIGQCMIESGAADRIVQSFLKILGEKRSSYAMMGSGFVLSIPVFLDTVFYLLIPLARSLYHKTNKNYLLYIMAICAGGAVTHTLVPPTPGPLLMAANLDINVGKMIIVGSIVGLPTAFIGLFYCKLTNRLMDVPVRFVETETKLDPIPDSELPPLWLALAPVALPVIMISSNTIVSPIVDAAKEKIPSKLAAYENLANSLSPYTSIIGNPNFALLVAMSIAMFLLYRQRKSSRKEMSEMVEKSLMGAGVIILITSGGGAFGAMLKLADIGSAIEKLFATGGGDHMLLFIGFGIAVLLKIAQGSGTVAMIIGSSMMAAMLKDNVSLSYDTVYLATAIGAGSMVGSWMNDSGFWIYAKMGGLTEAEALKTWTPLLAVLGFASMTITVILSYTLPFIRFQTMTFNIF